MEDLLLECCEKMIDLLCTLKENGSITQEEFNDHIKLKKKFIDDCVLSKIHMLKV